MSHHTNRYVEFGPPHAKNPQQPPQLAQNLQNPPIFNLNLAIPGRQSRSIQYFKDNSTGYVDLGIVVSGYVILSRKVVW